jgi:DNA-binding MarR family transcriptional regulator
VIAGRRRAHVHPGSEFRTIIRVRSVGRVGERLPLSTLLSQALVAFTMEFDNEAERQVTEAGWGRRFLVSQVMWANLLRFVDDDGVAIRDIPDRAGFPGTPVKTGWMHGCLAGMERWGYVTIGPAPVETRTAPRPDLLVTPTAAGRKARAVWLPLAGVIEERWRTRFGNDAVDQLRTSLVAVVGQVNVDLPRYLPVVVHGMRTVAPHLASMSVSASEVDAETASPLDLSALLAQTLLLFAVDVEQESVLSLAISANAMRVIDDDGTRIRDLPRLAGVSKEAIGVSVSFLERHGCVVVEADPTATRTKLARLTKKGRSARESIGPLLAVVEARWQAKFGTDEIERLHAALGALLDDPRLAEGLEPPATGWRANKPYAARTAALVANPRAVLPHFPMVTHRGGWPDGS